MTGAWYRLFMGEQLESVPERVVRVEAADARPALVPLDAHSGDREPGGDGVQVGHAEAGVGLAGRREVTFDAQVNPGLEPDAARRLHRLGLLHLAQAEQAGVEPPGGILAAR